MAGERHGVASWPGAIAVESCTYSMSHGISPGTAVLKLLPQANPPAMSGTLVIGDGAGAIVLPDCRVDDLRVEQDGHGFVWSLQISDRRWKWRDFGSISGAYNQLDEVHKKLIPWTIQSPRELATLCLELMGETGYTIDLPPGFDAALGKGFAGVNPPWIGVNPGNANPPANWENETPAVALQSLCEQFGRRVIYQAGTNSVLIAIPGRGADLPPGSIARESPSISNPARPSRVAVYGSPTRYQMRFLCEAVGEEWDGSFRPIDQLSYKPAAADGKPQISTATLTVNGSSNTFQVFIGADANDPPTTGALFEVTSSSSAGTVAASLAAAINASTDPRVAGKVVATVVSDVLTVTGVTDGAQFSFWSKMSGTPAGAAACNIVPALSHAAELATGGWQYTTPPLFPNVRATDRLRYEDALALAQKWIYKAYQITLLNPSGGPGIVRVPNYRDPIKRRQQFILTGEQVEQVVPQPLDQDLRDALGRPFLENFYNGYSRNKPAICFGSVATLRAGGVMNAFWVPAKGLTNTLRSQQIYADFRVEAENQLVVFANCQFRTDGRRFLPATPVLQTGVMIRNEASNALEVFVSGKFLPGVVDNNNVAVRKYPDVQLNIIGDYDAQHNLRGARLLEADAVKRAAFYVDGLAAQYPTAAALTREYNGIVPISLDGAISQVTWEIGPNGASTTASRNTEHSLYVPPYPARRRAEFLRPAQQAALQQAANPQDLGRSLHSPARPNEL
jgi:hypothetical protein